MRTPRVSIGMPLYNGEKYVKFAIESLLEQEFKDFELIISDNASTDGTRRICEEYAKLDGRIRYHRCAANVGATPNFNRVWSLAQGELFKWAAYDDECCPGSIKEYVEAFDAAPSDTSLIYSHCAIIDESGRVKRTRCDSLSIDAARPHARLRQLLGHMGTYDAFYGLIRAGALRKTRLLRPCLRNDCVLLAELAIQGPFMQLDRVLFRLREHHENASQANRSRIAHLLWNDRAHVIRGLLLPVREREVLEYLRGVACSQIGASEKARCCYVVLSTYYWRRIRTFAGRNRRRLAGMYHSKCLN